MGIIDSTKVRTTLNNKDAKDLLLRLGDALLRDAWIWRKSRPRLLEAGRGQRGRQDSVSVCLQRRQSRRPVLSQVQKRVVRCVQQVLEELPQRLHVLRPVLQAAPVPPRQKVRSQEQMRETAGEREMCEGWQEMAREVQVRLLGIRQKVQEELRFRPQKERRIVQKDLLQAGNPHA